MPSTMRIGLFSSMEPAGGSASDHYAGLIDVAQAAEDLGYHSLWVASRHLSPEYAAVPAPLVLLAAVAARTRRLVVGTGVVSLPLEDPLRVAEDFATLDAIAPGRAVLGVGSGDDPPAFESMGVDFASRGERMNELLPRLLGLLAGEQVGGRALYPRPDDPDGLVAVAAQSPRRAEWAAEVRAGLMLGRSEPGRPDPSPAQTQTAAAYRRLFEAGRVWVSRNAWVGPPDDPALLEGMRRHDAYLRSRGREPLPSDPEEARRRMNIPCGTPDELAVRLRTDVAPIGPNELLITVDPGGLPVGDTIKRLEVLAAPLGVSRG